MTFVGRNLTCVRSDRLVFRGLDFQATPGELLNLKGPNGSGKSSLLKLMAGLISPEAGELFWNGNEVSSVIDEFRANLRYISHLNPVKGMLTVRENIEFWISMENQLSTNYNVEKALRMLALDHLADLPARFLSSGQTRRLNLSRLGACNATLWLLDEPYNSLDEASSSLLNQTIGKHLDENGIVVMANHNTSINSENVIDLSKFSETNSSSEG